MKVGLPGTSPVSCAGPFALDQLTVAPNNLRFIDHSLSHPNPRSPLPESSRAPNRLSRRGAYQPLGVAGSSPT